MLTFVLLVFCQQCMLGDVIYSAIYTFFSSVTRISQLARNVCILFRRYLVFVCARVYDLVLLLCVFFLLLTMKKLSIDPLN